MATLNGIIEKIKEINPEIQALPQTVVKNTVTMQGLCLKTATSKIAPCIYIDKMLNSHISDEKAAEKILAIYNQAGIDIDPSIFRDKDFVLNHLYLGLQRRGKNCEYLTRESPWDEIIKYMYIRSEAGDGTSCSVKVTDGLLMRADIDEELAWSIAEKATCNEIDIKSLLDVFSECTDEYEDRDKEDFKPPFYVASNKLRLNGAAVALNQEYIRNWAAEHSFDKIVLIFSSIHEALILPADDTTDLDTISAMMQEVNKTHVKVIERLADKAYVINL